MAHQCCNVDVGDRNYDDNDEANGETINTDNNFMKQQ